MDDIPEEYIGPKMAALRDDRMRRFAWFIGTGSLNASRAARDAGYSPHAAGSRVQAHKLQLRPDVQAAIREVAERAFEGLMPAAIQATKAILENERHPAHDRVALAVLDRTGFGAKSEHKVTVEHRDMTGPMMLARINELAAKFGIAPRVQEPLLLEATEVARETRSISESDPAGGAASAGGQDAGRPGLAAD